MNKKKIPSGAKQYQDTRIYATKDGELYLIYKNGKVFPTGMHHRYYDRVTAKPNGQTTSKSKNCLGMLQW